jgi:hypothetical protein
VGGGDATREGEPEGGLTGEEGALTADCARVQALLRPWHVSLGEEEVKMPAGWTAADGKESAVS